MPSCFSFIIILISPFFLLVSLLRWFEQTGEAVDRGNWSRLILLIFAPFAVWLYPSSVAAGRPSAVPKHEPIRGFGGLPKGGIQPPVEQARGQDRPMNQQPTQPQSTIQASSDRPPPGTPAEFIDLPKIPPKKSSRAIDPEKIAKLKQKMKEQGMLGEEE